MPPKKIPPLKKGLLTSLGYSTKESATLRHIALNKAIKQYGQGNIVNKLNAVSTLTKNTNPKVSETFKRDMKYVQTK